MSIVCVQNLCKTYPSFQLNQVSFSLEAGTITGFIGRNGAGKTTTIKCMLNLVHLDSGEISYFGLPFLNHEAEIKEKIGYSTGILNWYPHKKIYDIAHITSSFFPNWDDTAYRDYCRLFQLDENKTPFALSEGMKVKCNLLMALSHHAKILILDEPTSGLDPFSRDELTEIMTGLKHQGVAVFFSTHITSDIEKCADNIIYIHNGNIVSAMSKEMFREQFSLEVETLEDTFIRLERRTGND